MNRRVNILTWITCAVALLWMLLAASGVLAQEWITTNQVTIAWDASADTGAISYNIYTRDIRTAQDILVANTVDVQYVLTFTVEGRYLAGVQTVRIPEGETEELTSEITWSDSTDAVAVPNPFGLKFYENPLAPIGLRPGN